MVWAPHVVDHRATLEKFQYRLKWESNPEARENLELLIRIYQRLYRPHPSYAAIEPHSA